MKVRVSLICTVKNEERSIGRLLDTLMSQLRPPDEIIMVDGGSKDRTKDIIKSYVSRSAHIRLISADGANIAEGRNIAVQNSRYDIIASTDAGCELEDTWLENLTAPFEKDPSVDVVSGIYHYTGTTPFGKAAAKLLNRKMPMMGDVFSPSSRSLAFKKEAWERVGGYPEHLRISEDTTFNLMLKAVGCRFIVAEDAIVRAETRRRPQELYKQYYQYSKWDVIAKNANSPARLIKAVFYTTSSAVLVIATALSPPIGLAMIGPAGLYYVIKYGVLLDKNAIGLQNTIYGPIALFSIMAGEILGAFSGLIERRSARSSNMAFASGNRTMDRDR